MQHLITFWRLYLSQVVSDVISDLVGDDIGYDVHAHVNSTVLGQSVSEVLVSLTSF